MASPADKILAESVAKDDDGTYRFACPGVAGSPCGDAERGPFTSSGWPAREIAAARGRQHFDEHKGIAITPSLDEFRAEHGLTVTPAGAVVKLGDI
jgi:hypothetical protein